MDVFNGTRTLVRWTSRRVAVGLVQQALVDLGYDLGAFGPRGDGVDQFGPVTEQAIRNFQTNEAVTGASPGVIDSPLCDAWTRSVQDV
ncbi:MAG: peptidoglycan-binding protein [Candidatus Moduliflexus flocculans]|nr:peptidoglycan-binding protein [Candidatus Moduliflexus flocculans]